MDHEERKYRIHMKFSENIGVVYEIMHGEESLNTNDMLSSRRLSTASFGKEKKPLTTGSFHTQWRWYFQDDVGQWVLFDKVGYVFCIVGHFSEWTGISGCSFPGLKNLNTVYQIISVCTQFQLCWRASLNHWKLFSVNLIQVLDEKKSKVTHLGDLKILLLFFLIVVTDMKLQHKFVTHNFMTWSLIKNGEILELSTHLK